MRNITNPFTSLLMMMMTVSLLIVGPFAILARIIYVRSIDRFEESLISTKLVETQSFANLLARDIDMLNTQMNDILSNKLVITLPIRLEAQSLDTSFAEKIQTIQSSMQSKQNSNNLLDYFYIYYTKYQKQISIDSFRSYMNQEAIQLENITSQSSHNLAISDNNLVYWLPSRWQNTENGTQPSIIVTGTISNDSMHKYMKRYISDASTSQFAVSIQINEENQFFAATSNLFNQFDIPTHDGKKDGLFSEHLIHNDQHYLLTGSYMSEKNMTFYQMTPLNSIMMPLEKYKQTMTVFQLIIIIFSIFSTFLMYLMIYRPIAHARHTFLRMESGDLSTRMGKSWYREFQDMFHQFDSMSDHIQDLIEREYELRFLQARAELKQLQYQISPHFLYNTYFILRGLLQEEEFEKATLLSDVIGKYLRYITVSNQDQATLKEEIEHAKAYAQIQRIRYSNRVQVHFTACPAEFTGINVPKIILQPLIENAFEHGVKQRINNGIIKITFSGDSDNIVIEVEDNGECLTQEILDNLNEMLTCDDNTHMESIALHNINSRLRMTYGPGSGLKFTRSSLGGLCCTLTLPKE